VDDRQTLYDWIAQRYPDSRPVEERVRAGRRRVLGIAMPAAVLAAALAVLFMWSTAADLRAEHDIPLWQEVTGWALLLAGVGWQVVPGWRTAMSTRSLKKAWSADGLFGVPAESRGLWALTGAQRSALRRQVAGKAPVAEEDLPATRVIARAQVAAASTMATLPTLPLIAIGLTVRRPTLPNVALAVLTCVGVLVCLTALPRQSGRARRFLAEHPAA